MTNNTDHARQQAMAQVESIVEMVAALTLEGAADLYASKCDRDECAKLLKDADADTDTSDDFADYAEREDDPAYLAELREALAEAIKNGDIEPKDFNFDQDDAQQTIQDDALDVNVRSDWYTPGDPEAAKPSEFMILLCTGGPAVRLIGSLDENLEADRVRIEYQDWGTPWTEYFPESEELDALLTYAQQFYFGE